MGGWGRRDRESKRRGVGEGEIERARGGGLGKER